MQVNLSYLKPEDFKSIMKGHHGKLAFIFITIIFAGLLFIERLGISRSTMPLVFAWMLLTLFLFVSYVFVIIVRYKRIKREIALMTYKVVFDDQLTMSRDFNIDDKIEYELNKIKAIKILKVSSQHRFYLGALAKFEDYGFKISFDKEDLVFNSINKSCLKDVCNFAKTKNIPLENEDVL